MSAVPTTRGGAITPALPTHDGAAIAQAMTAVRARLSTSKHRQLPRVLRRAVGLLRFARATVGANAASLFLVDATAGTLRGIVSEWDWIRTSFASRLHDWPTVERALVDGELRTITEEQASGDEVVWFEPRGIVSTVCVPLRTSKGPVGVLFFDFDTETSGPTDNRFLADVGDRLGRALGRDRSWTPQERAFAPLQP